MDIDTAFAGLPVPGSFGNPPQRQERRLHRNGPAGTHRPAVVFHRLAIFQHGPRGRHPPGLNAGQLDLDALHRIPAYRPRHPARPDFGDDAGGHQHGLADGAYLQPRLHGGRERLPTVLCLPRPFHIFNVRLGGGHQHLPDVHLLGTGRGVVLLANRLLLHQARSRLGFEKGLHRDPFRRHVLPDGHPAALLLHQDLRFRPVVRPGQPKHLRFGCRQDFLGRRGPELGHGLDFHRRSR